MNDLKRILIIGIAAFIMILLCLWIKDFADTDGWKTAYKYNIAIPAEKQDEFNYDVDSKQGLVLSRGEFETKNGAKFDDQKESFTYVEEVHERYTRHTQTYSCGSSKHPRTCTRVYYSWDRVGSEEKYADKTTYFGREYPTSNFNLSNFVTRVDGYHRKDFSDRYYYNVVPLKFTASFLTNTSEGRIDSAFGGQVKLETVSIEQLRKDSLNYKVVNNVIVTIVAIIILIGASIGAWHWVWADGRWSLKH